tara:strand:+ start:52 stop:534 length:483 start_codon:yes stop_codon:yes gene_type:complete
MTEENQIKERGPSPLGCSIIIILVLFIVIIVFFTWFSPWYYGKSARVMATKTIHAQTIKYIKSEYDKCRNGETLIMNNTLKCSDMDSKSLIQAALNTMTDKNPHHPDHPNAHRTSSSNTNDEDVGYVSLSASGSNIIIKTCIKTPCKKEENRLQTSIKVK